MIVLGSACLILALVAAMYAVGAALAGTRGDRRWVDSSRRAVYALAALLTLAVVIVEAAFLRSDFSFRLVADHSSTTTPTGYKMTAMWSSQGGSLLLWAWVFLAPLCSSGRPGATPSPPPRPPSRRGRRLDAAAAPPRDGHASPDAL